jgi:hypothetical protein
MSERSRTVDTPRALVEGQRLDQPTFHALYEAMPPGTRAELIGGVVSWFEQKQVALVRKEADADGLFRSAVFPGLWLDPKALLKGDRRRLRAVVDLGCATPEHAAFVARLAAFRKTT